MQKGELLIPYGSDRLSTEKLKIPTRVLVLGGTGLVGEPFVKSIGTTKGLELIAQPRIDVTKKSEIKAALTAEPLDAIVFYVAYTNVPKAQKEDRQLCLDVNVGGVLHLLESMVETGVNPHICFVSTNLVFPSHATPRNGLAFCEDEPIDDVDISSRVYSGSKAVAERLLSEFVMDHSESRIAIARINQPIRHDFPARPERSDYLRKHLGLAASGKLYPLLTDAWIGLTDIEEFAENMQQLLREKRTGVYHFSSTRTTPFDLLDYAVRRAGIDFVVQRTTYNELVAANKLDPNLNPRFSDLDQTRTGEILGIPTHPWQSIVDKLVGQE